MKQQELSRLPSHSDRTRREFISDSITTASAFAIPAAFTSTALATPIPRDANSKIRVGLIGAGNRAKWLTRALSRDADRAELVSVCDCHLPQVEVLADEYRNSAKGEPHWTAYQNYEEMFDKEDLDAVMIATPDHVRVRAAMMACTKGLDVYAEKPLSFSIPEGRALVKAVRKYKRVLQVGTQQRSTANNQYSCKFVRDGGLGNVHTILVKNYSGSRGATGLEKQVVPEGMDWNRFCDQASLLDYHEQLHRRWRNFDTFTGGSICDRGSHALDMVHLAMGWENIAPTRIVPIMEAKSDRERGVRLYYPNGTVVRLESDNGPAFGGIFIGEKGKMEINRGRFACNPKMLLAPFEGQESENHVGNWLDCIESRQEPNAPVEVGHLITSVAHLINICRTVGRPIEWDQKQEQITNDKEANNLLVQVRRPEFALPTL